MRIGILGYGNLGRGVALLAGRYDGIRLRAVFSRRPDIVKRELSGVEVFGTEMLRELSGEIDVLINCGGSSSDLPKTTPQYAEYFNIVDSFDNHSAVREHLNATDLAAKRGGRVAVVGAGWDPGLFSVYRAYCAAVFPDSPCYSFWGKGVSQGHTEAVRRISGVLDARQYTVPLKKARRAVAQGGEYPFAPAALHRRVCYVVCAKGACRAEIRNSIKTMPAYFAPYKTSVRFISQRRMQKHHSSLSHGGEVICRGKTGERGEHLHTAALSLRLSSNPEFTAAVMLAYARAALRLSRLGFVGCVSAVDIPPALLIPEGDGLKYF